MTRFDGWEESAEVKSTVVSEGDEAPKVEAKEPEKEPETKKEEPKKPEEEAKADDTDGKKPPETDEPEEVKGLKSNAFKLREKNRALKEQLATIQQENEKLKSQKELNVDDFDSFEDYEKAKVEVKPKAKADPLVIDAVSALNKKFEKAGLDVEEMKEALTDMKFLPPAVLVALADRKDAALVAKWLAENEDTDEAQEALHARTETGRMRYLDDIAELAKAGAKKAVQPKNEPPIETITRVPGGGQTKSLDGLPPEEFAKATGAGRGNRWDW